jgi:hypothetical protein
MIEARSWPVAGREPIAVPAIPPGGSPGGSGRLPELPELTDRQRTEAQSRRAMLLAGLPALKANLGLEAAARLAGTSAATLCRILQLAHDQCTHIEKAMRLIHGPVELLAPGKSTGASCKWDVLLLIEAVRNKLDSLYLSTLGASSEYMTHGRRTGSLALTLLRFAEESECPEELGRKLRQGYQPTPFVAYLRRITPELEARVRGAKHSQLHGVVMRRDQSLRTPDGQRVDNISGFLVEFDDMSLNQPFWVEGPTGEPILSRQGLYARDVRSGRWLGVELIARPRESYRAEDILRFMRRLMMDYGKFDVLRLERGIWASRSIKGDKLKPDGAIEEETGIRPEMAAEEKEKIKDGLRRLGLLIQYTHNAHQKGGIESGFSYLQTVIASYAMDLVNVGRHAGEFENAAKQVRRVRAGSHHPADLGFPSMDEAASRVERAFSFINRKPPVKDAPDTVWSQDMAKRPLPALTQRDLAVFLPERRELQIRGGRVTAYIAGQPYDFRAEILIQLGHGYRVRVDFDPGEPTLGAAIYNLESGSVNHFGYSLGEFIAFARWEAPGPQGEIPDARGLTARSLQETYGQNAEDIGRGTALGQKNWVRTGYRGLPKVGQGSTKTSEQRDGKGGLARVESGGAAKLAPAVPQPAPKRTLVLDDDDLECMAGTRPSRAKASASLSMEAMNEL